MSFLPSDLVLVTGANGHLAQHIIDQLLALPNPPRVRGTVRALDKALPIFAHYPSQFDQGLLEASHIEGIFARPNRNSLYYQIVVVEDITTPGAFDKAIKGMRPADHPVPLYRSLHPFQEPRMSPTSLRLFPPSRTT